MCGPVCCTHLLPFGGMLEYSQRNAFRSAAVVAEFTVEISKRERLYVKKHLADGLNQGEDHEGRCGHAQGLGS